MKNTIFFFAALLFLTLTIPSANAQFSEDFRAKDVLTRVYTDIKGSPYLAEDFLPAVVKMKDGKTFKDIPLKYDQVTGELIFKDPTGKLVTFADPVAEFRFTGGKLANQAYRAGFSSTEQGNVNTFYQVLYDGGTIVLKDARKNLIEHRAYNSSTPVKSIVETPAYYLVMGNTLEKIRKDKKSVLLVLKDKATELDKYITENKLNLKEDADLARLLQYYDSIKGT